MDRYLFQDHVQHDFSKQVFEIEEIDPNEIYEKGFISNKITESLNKKFIQLFKRLEFKEYKMDQIEHGAGFDYSFNENGFRPIVELLVDSIYKHFACILTMFDVPESPVGLELGVCKLSDGYCVDWHQDCRNQAVLSFCMVLNEEDFKEGEGGELQFSKVTFDESGDIIDREIVGRFPTNNSGQIIFFNPSDLNYQHRCTQIKSTKTRYLVAGIIGEIE